MRPSTLLAVLVAPILALGKVVITSTSYSKGEVKLGIQSYSDAPESFAVKLVSADGTSSDLVTSTTTGTGVLDIALPNVPAGSYKVQVTSADGSEQFSTSKSFTVGSSDFASTSRGAASYTLSITGSAKPLLTTSLVTNSVGSTTVGTFTLGPNDVPGTTSGGSVTGTTSASGTASTTSSAAVSTLTSTSVTTVVNSTTVLITTVISTDSVVTTGSVTTTVPVSLTITTSALSTTASAATATIVTTSRSAGFKTSATVFSFLAAVVAGALLM